ncbi:WW domain-binding protein 4 [Microdochium nivale]|nr:WW domain-binding protein 4 [Microdochium nivale]
MSEYWKSTPKYWCKHCSMYVRDTGLERRNHESTGKHQGALKRFLRDIHRDHEREERDKDRARREVERLNGAVGGGSSGGGAGGASSSSRSETKSSLAAAGPATQEQRQRQWEQLADMGIDVPTELRPEMAMAGGWTVTKTRVVNEGDDAKSPTTTTDVSTATGTRKRVKPEENEEEERRDEEEKAVQGLFKKPRRWGRDTKEAHGDDAELDALLSGSLVPKIAKTEEGEAKTAASADTNHAKEEPAESQADIPAIKKEESDAEDRSLESAPLAEAAPPSEATMVKQEDLNEVSAGPDVPVVMFKKRKGKENIRQKKAVKS